MSSFSSEEGEDNQLSPASLARVHTACEISPQPHSLSRSTLIFTYGAAKGHFLSFPFSERSPTPAHQSTHTNTSVTHSGACNYRSRFCPLKTIQAANDIWELITFLPSTLQMTDKHCQQSFVNTVKTRFTIYIKPRNSQTAVSVPYCYGRWLR